MVAAAVLVVIVLAVLAIALVWPPRATPRRLRDLGRPVRDRIRPQRRSRRYW